MSFFGDVVQNLVGAANRSVDPTYARQLQEQQYNDAQASSRQAVFSKLMGNPAYTDVLTEGMEPIEGKGFLGGKFDREGLFARALANAQTKEGFDLASKGFLSPNKGRNKALTANQFLTGQDGRIMVGNRGDGSLKYATLPGQQPAYAAQYDPRTMGNVKRAQEDVKIGNVTRPDGSTAPMRLGDVVNGRENKTNVKQNWKWEGKSEPTPEQLNLINKDLNGAPSTPQRYGQTTRDLEKTKADVAVGKEADIQNDALRRQFGQLHDKLTTPYNGQSIEDMIRGSTSSGFGSNMDAVGDYVGIADDKSINSATLNTLSGWLTSNVPRMEGPQGEKDVELYRKMAGDIASATSVEKRLSIYKNLVSLTEDMEKKFSSGYYEKTNNGNNEERRIDARIEELKAKIAAKKAAQNDR